MKTNNYPSWLVSVEQAKKLKEIGFDEYCVFYTRVLKNGETSNYTISVCRDTYDKIIPGIRNKDHIDTDNTFGISLPTFEQVFEWFRNKGFRILLENHEDSTSFMFYNMKIKEAYEITEALRKLTNIRDVYNEGWEPDWENNREKYVIKRLKDGFMLYIAVNEKSILYFKSIEIAKKFFEEQKELLELAKPLL